MVAAPKVNAAAWFALAVAAPLALLAVAAAAGKSGPAQQAGFWAAMLLAPAIVLALRSLEKRRFESTPQEARDQDLTRAFCLTTGQACGLLFVVAAGAKFSGESVAVGLAMAACPLSLAVGRNVWRRLVPSLDERLATASFEASASRNWTAEWLQAEALRAPAPPPAAPEAERPRLVALATPAMASLGAPGRVTLQVRPVDADEGWMTTPFDEPVRAPAASPLEILAENPAEAAVNASVEALVDLLAEARGQGWRDAWDDGWRGERPEASDAPRPSWAARAH